MLDGHPDQCTGPDRGSDRYWTVMLRLVALRRPALSRALILIAAGPLPPAATLKLIV